MLLPALEQAIDAVVIIDARNAVTFFNRAAETLWGYDREEILGRNVKFLVPRPLQAGHDRAIASNRETGVNKIVGTSREILVERKDGSHIWASFSLSKVRMADDWHYMAFVRDIGEEVRQRDANRLLSLVVDATDQAVLVLDQDRRIVHANNAFTDLFGYEVNEVLGKLPSVLLSSRNTDPEALKRLRELGWQGIAFQMEILGAQKSARDLWVSVSVNPVRGDDGTVENLVAIISDITERRHIENLQRSIAEAMASGLSLAEIMDVLCRQLEIIAPEIMASVMAIEDAVNDERLMRTVAAPSVPQEFQMLIDGLPIGEDVGSCGTAAWRGESVLVSDIENDPLWERYKGLVRPFGLKACWSSPIKRRDGAVAGTFAFYFREPRAPSAFHKLMVDACLHLCTVAFEREESRQQIARLAQFDSLTGLPNRAHMYRRIDASIASEPDECLAIFVLDLDHFKDLNDTRGHSVGDKMLFEVASRLEMFLGGRGFVGRIDGDTFALVGRRCRFQQASLLAQEILRELRKPIEIEGTFFSMTASIGISLYPKNGLDSETLVKNADLAMHRSKASGRGKYMFFSAEMNDLASERLLLGAKLRAALAENRLKLHYQPQVWTDRGDLCGVEALARWTDPERGPIPPDKFIPLAEEIGEIMAIGRWSLREACRQMAEWRAKGVVVPTVSVNVSTHDFRFQDLPDFVDGLLREFTLPPQSLTLEITETAMMDAEPETFDTIEKVRALGVGLSMDDFGTGFASLASLSRLPVTELKIDRSFMCNIEHNADARALTTASIRIGQSLGLGVVAEGVETEGQAQLLAHLGCEALQGYLFAKPMPPEDFEAWLGSYVKKSWPIR